jgi:hypothetical protein
MTCLEQGELRAGWLAPRPPRHGERTERRSLLGDQLRGVLADAGFFLGPRSFYSQLREMPVEGGGGLRARIAWVNDLGGPARAEAAAMTCAVRQRR